MSWNCKVSFWPSGFWIICFKNGKGEKSQDRFGTWNKVSLKVFQIFDCIRFRDVSFQSMTAKAFRYSPSLSTITGGVWGRTEILGDWEYFLLFVIRKHPAVEMQRKKSRNCNLWLQHQLTRSCVAGRKGGDDTGSATTLPVAPRLHKPWLGIRNNLKIVSWSNTQTQNINVQKRD